MEGHLAKLTLSESVQPTVPGSNEKQISILLNNLAAARMDASHSLSQCHSAFLSAVLAFRIDPDYAKALIRAGKVARMLDKGMMAPLFCMAEAKRLGAGSAEILALAPLSNLPQSLMEASPIDLAILCARNPILPLGLPDRDTDPALAQELKDRGNAAYKAGRSKEADEHYRSALSHLKASSLSPMLLKRAQASPKPAEMILDCMGALLLGGLDAECKDAAGCAMAEALLKLGAIEESVTVCRTVGRAAQSIESEARSFMPSARHLEELEAFKAMRVERKQSHARVEHVALLNELMEKGPVDAKDKLRASGMSTTLDKRVPPFHKEFKAAVGDSVCTDEAFTFLWDGYETARSSHNDPSTFMTASKNRDRDIIKRLHGQTDPDRVKWYCEAPMGTVKFRETRGYNSFMLHGISNAAHRKLVMHMGTVHVAVGFVDLGTLRSPILMDNDDPSSNAPLRWVGVEASAYSVARSLVVAEALKDPLTSPDDALQIWFSSSWSKAAERAFYRALGRLLSAKAPATWPVLKERKVLLTLRHWANAEPVSLQEARAKFLSMRDHSCSSLANYKEKADRLALARYLTTGELLPETCTTGSVVMHRLPPLLAGTLEEESVFNCFESTEVWKERAEQPDMVAAVTAILRRDLGRLAERLRSGVITLEFILESLSLENKKAIDRIRSLEAYSMSWSNVLDYCQPCDFHRLAFALSGPETVHCCYSMNWPTETKGASALDYPPEMFKRLWDASCEGIAMMGSILPIVTRLFLHPPIDNPMNVTDNVLCQQARVNWVEAFMQEGKKVLPRSPPRLAGGTEGIMGHVYDPLVRATTTSHFAFTYNQEMHMFVSKKS